MKKKVITIQLDGALQEFVEQAAALLNCSPQQVIENLLFAKIAERSAMQVVFPDEPGKHVIRELLFIRTPDGKKILQLTGEQLYAVIREEKIKELREIERMRTFFERLHEYQFSLTGGANA